MYLFFIIIFVNTYIQVRVENILFTTKFQVHLAKQKQELPMAAMFVNRLG
jgi:hypothetical protein